MSSLKEFNGGYKECSYDSSQIERLISSMEQNGKHLIDIKSTNEVLVEQHRDVIRWLLWVVCIIALGSKLVEMANNIWGARVNTFQTEQTK